MDESIKCECGNDKFWWFGEFLRCPICFNEYKRTGNGKEYWLRRFNKEENYYNENWEHFNPHFVIEAIQSIPLLNPFITGQFRAFWLDRWSFELWCKEILEGKHWGMAKRFDDLY